VDLGHLGAASEDPLQGGRVAGQLDLESIARVEPSQDVLDPARDQHPPALDDPHRVAEVRQLGEDVRRDHDRLAQVAQRLDDLAELDARRGVEPRGGLVEEEHVGVVDEGLRQQHPLTPALREPTALVLAALADAGQLDGAVDPAAPLSSGQAVGAGVELEVLRDAQLVVKMEGVGHEAQLPPDSVGLALGVAAVDPHPSRVGAIDRGQDPEGRRLPGAVGSDEPVGRAALDFQIQPLQRSRAAEGPPQVLGDEHAHRWILAGVRTGVQGFPDLAIIRGYGRGSPCIHAPRCSVFRLPWWLAWPPPRWPTRSR
jgi:hypothetical protein